MARFLIVLDPNASQAQRDDAVAAITGNDGEIVALFDPVAVVAEGDASVQTALSALQGNGVLATDTNGSLDPASLDLTDDQTLLVSAWTGTFSADVQGAIADRFRDGDDWGFQTSCEIG
jgi:hypothetical protein